MLKITPGFSRSHKLHQTGFGAVIIFFLLFFAVAGTAFPAAADASEQAVTDGGAPSLNEFIGYDANDGGGRRAIKFSRVVGMVYDLRSSRGLKNCDIRVGKIKARTDANGYFEIPSMLCDEYIITAVLPPYERHIDVVKLNSPLKAVKIYLEMPEVKISETKKANLEYDRLLARIMKGSVNEISINGDGGAQRKKPSYTSKYGSKQMIEEDAGGRKYSKKSGGEVSKAPHISADKGFGLLICSVFESSGAEIEGNARILIATQAVETLKSRPVEIHNVPVGNYKITVKCEGYADKVYDKVAVKQGKNERSFFIDKSKK
jgi:hypothetical protein